MYTKSNNNNQTLTSTVCRRALSLTMLITLLLVTLEPVRSATVTVTTAQQLSTALQTANTGDIIVLDSTVTFSPTSPLIGRSLTNVVVRGSGSTPAVIDCSNVHGDYCLAFRSSGQLSLANVEVTNFGSDGGLFFGKTSQVTITGVSVTQGLGSNVASMAVSFSNNVVIDGLTVANNVNQLASSGLQFAGCTSCTLRNSLLANNQATVLSALSIFQSTMTVKDTVVRGNRGIGNNKVDGSVVDFQGCTFSGNDGSASSVVDITSATVRFLSCDITGNTGTGGGEVASMFNIFASNATFQCSNVSGNTGTSSDSPASLINFVGEGPVVWPNAVACTNGNLFHSDVPLDIACNNVNPPSTLVLLGSVFFDASGLAPAIRLEWANVVGVGAQLSSPQPLLITNSSYADFTSADNRISGSVQCMDSQAVWGSQVCGTSPCACGSVASGSPSLSSNPDPSVCVATSITVVVPVNNATVIVTGPPGTTIEPTTNPDSSAPVVSPVVNITVNGTGGEVGPVTITLPYNCSQEGFCLAFYDVNKSRWECVDKCLDISQKGETCYATGQTPHLTSFALLLTGDVNACGQTDRFYQWATIVALSAAAVLCILVIVVFGYVPYLSEWCLGKEGARVKKLRKHVAGLDLSAEGDVRENREELPPANAEEEEV